ncbi:phytoene desaturase family protein [Streptomyces olivaceus]|uniref:phytoene desaturase family protein n=1 Tax=Streptomyces olivaceus TaxID=47716 RepID=UPI001CC9B8A3|nr:NAD(P)/FAD-dependent oxidoreductase [Streptomyces olivaceus]MBZ6293970.1 NAD(P)/FAD-dependent oxidoreductase [Streptomyces olivaceus]MBZ6324700.1 NAD(P)/FAD-dependent oxidoreductase [Streptomyces olivaceus]
MARIAVIGAGMGAMAAAARLAVAGHRVVVYERTGTYGGALGRFERDGFSFDTGPGLLPLPAVWRDLFVKTGKEPLESRVDLVQVDPSSRHVFADGTEVALPNASRAGVVAALDAALGAAAAARWGDFLVRARETWDRTRRPLLEEPLWPNWEVLAEREPYPSVPHRRLLRTRRAGTLAEVGALELRDPRLAALLDAHALAHGLDPRTAPANAAVLPYMEYAFGMWYVRGGGLRELARAVYERCLARRVEFRFGTEVTAVVEKDGRVRGVEPAEGVVEEAEFVVAGVPPDVLDRLRGGAGGTPVRPGGGVPPQRGGASRLTVLLALRGGRPEGTAHRTVVHARDREAELDGLFGAGPGMAAQPTVTVLRPDDPALVPDADHEAVTLSAPVPAPPAGTRRAAAGESARQQAERLIDVAGRAVPGLRDRLLWHEVRGPADVAAATGAADGAIPAPALAGAGGRLLHAANTTGTDGLFTVGGWSHPGGGLPHAGMSGALVAGLMVEGPEFRGSQ